MYVVCCVGETSFEALFITDKAEWAHYFIDDMRSRVPFNRHRGRYFMFVLA